MSTLHVRILTPSKVVKEEEATSVTVPSVDGEITILPKHVKLLSLLNEGVLTLRNEKAEDHLAIGGGYLETNGKNLNILVSRAYGQTEINEDITKKALEEAKNIMKEEKDHVRRSEAISIMRRSLIDLKLLKKRKTKHHAPETQSM